MTKLKKNLGWERERGKKKKSIKEEENRKKSKFPFIRVETRQKRFLFGTRFYEKKWEHMRRMKEGRGGGGKKRGLIDEMDVNGSETL